MPKKEVEKLIKDFLYQQLDGEEAGLTACLVIHTVNKPKEKVRASVAHLLMLLTNLASNSGPTVR